MMSYLAKRLAPGEVIVHSGRFHWIRTVYAWGALIVLGVVLIGIFLWLAELIRLATTEFVVTNRRVVLKQGFFNVKVDELTLSSIEGAHIDQSIFGRLLGYGTLTMRGRGDTHLTFPAMVDPAAFRSAAEGARIDDETKLASLSSGKASV
jgi:uncharacterized membrane protein YdbT with pleckstrin-like domain